MSKQKITITDPNFREYDKNVEEQLKKYEATKLAQAEKREQEKLNKRGIIDIFLEGTDKISKLFSQKKKKEIENINNKNKNHSK